MYLVCSDLEGVFVPEVWINVAKKTGIDELKLTTRDIPDYSVLMRKRLSILKEHKLKINDIRQVIATMKPLDGALQFIHWIKKYAPFHLVSDTFVEFADPLMKQLERPSLFCNSLIIDDAGNITDFVLRQPDQKRKVVQAFKGLNYKVVSFGDSYNDISMLKEADKGFFYCPPASVIDDHPDIPVAYNYEDLKSFLHPYLIK